MGRRILKVCTSRSWGGMEMSMTVTADRLRSRGHEVLPVCYPGSPIHERLLALDFEPLCFDLWGKFHPFKALRLSRIINGAEIDIVHTDYSRDLFTLVPALKMAKPTPLVLHKHVGTKNPKNLPVHPWLYGRVDCAIGISEVIASNLVETHPLRPDQVRLIHHGIDMERFRPHPGRRRTLRRELGLDEDGLLVGIVGRLQHHKGHLEFLEVARRLLPRHPGTRFVIVGEATRGESGEADAIVDVLESAGLGDHLILTGYRDDVPDLLGAMDVFLFPTKAEAFGLVIVEAMAMGVPVVSSDCDGVPDIVVDGETGFLRDPTDVPALADAVEDLLADVGLRAAFGAAGRQRALRLFSLDRMCEKMEALYEELIARYR